MNVADNTIFIAAQDQFSCEVSEEAVILDMRTGTYFGLNSVGASIWKLLSQPRSVSQLRDAISAEYEVEPARCEADIQILIEELLQQKLIEIQS